MSKPSFGGLNLLSSEDRKPGLGRAPTDEEEEQDAVPAITVDLGWVMIQF